LSLNPAPVRSIYEYLRRSSHSCPSGEPRRSSHDQGEPVRYSDVSKANLDAQMMRRLTGKPDFHRLVACLGAVFDGAP
jgi:hypothetical protein